MKAEKKKMADKTSPIKPSEVFSNQGKPEWIFDSIPKGSQSSERFYYTGHWIYQSEAGETIGAVVRYDGFSKGKPEKSFLPYFRKKPNGFRPGHVPGEAHKLFNLDQLVNNKVDPVWIGEGEQAASALGIVGALSTTSPNGSKSSQKSDWSSISGKDVILWQDADKPGILYAKQVQAICQSLGVKSIRFVDLEALSSIL